MISGGRRVGDALRIKRASGGRTKIVCIGRPWARLDLFDAVVTTAQYCLPERSNVLENTLTLNSPDAAVLNQAARHWGGRFAALPRPWIAVLVGGNSGSYVFDAGSARRLAEEANALAQKRGGSLLVATSPRTPAASIRVIEQSLDCPHVLHTWSPQKEDNPYLAFLALADRFVVTCDSASILSQACATGKPVRLFEFPQRLTTRIMTKLQRPFLRYLAGLTGAGLWVPARDMPRFHDRLRRQGLLEESGGGGEGAGAAVLDDLGRTVRMLEGLMPERQRPGAGHREIGAGAAPSVLVSSHEEQETAGDWVRSGAVAGKPARGA